MIRVRRGLVAAWAVSMVAVTLVGVWATIPMVVSSGAVMLIRLVEVRWL